MSSKESLFSAAFPPHIYTDGAAQKKFPENKKLFSGVHFPAPPMEKSESCGVFRPIRPPSLDRFPPSRYTGDELHSKAMKQKIPFRNARKARRRLVEGRGGQERKAAAEPFVQSLPWRFARAWPKANRYLTVIRSRWARRINPARQSKWYRESGCVCSSSR